MYDTHKKHLVEIDKTSNLLKPFNNWDTVEYSIFSGISILLLTHTLRMNVTYNPSNLVLAVRIVRKRRTTGCPVL